MGTVPRLQCASFNQDGGCFVVGYDSGFAVYSSHPLAELARRDFGRGVRLAAMLNRSNIVALVGGGADPLAPGNKVLIWDDLYENNAPPPSGAHQQMPTNTARFGSAAVAAMAAPPMTAEAAAYHHNLLYSSGKLL